MHSSFFKELLRPSIKRNASRIHPFLEIPSLVGYVVVAMVIVINYVIGGFSWVHLIWLADVHVTFQFHRPISTPHNNNYILVKNKAVNAPIKFEKIVMVMTKKKNNLKQICLLSL